jgi:hypothetical protein
VVVASAGCPGWGDGKGYVGREWGLGGRKGRGEGDGRGSRAGIVVGGEDWGKGE